MADERSTDNVTGRSIPARTLHRPTHRDEVVALVKSARRRGVALYPFSTGLNWGYGSRSPTAPNCELVDLSGMCRILNVDQISADHPVALIEPGVTQGALYDHLRRHHPTLTFNVTGSAPETSIIGNALDRGVGYHGPRKEDLFGLEVVTGTGELLRTGFRRLGERSPLAQDHPYGLGPMLDGLFFQSNFGIVTSACFQLRPRRPTELTVSLALRPGVSLADYLNVLASLKRENLMHTVTHVAHRSRTRSTIAPGIADYLEAVCGFTRVDARAEAERILDEKLSAEWTSLGSIAGNRLQVVAMMVEIRRRTRRVASVRMLTETMLDRAYAAAHAMRWLPSARRSAAFLSGARPLQALPAGRPSSVAVDVLLRGQGAAGPSAAVALDRSRCGLLYINPALPSDGAYVEQMVQRLRGIAREHGHELHVTINLETSSSMVAVMNLLFDRGSATETARAHACAAVLLETLHAAGLEVYRARADMMSQITSRDPDYWRLVGRIKAVFDPDGIMSPGRYGLAPE